MKFQIEERIKEGVEQPTSGYEAEGDNPIVLELQRLANYAQALFINREIAVTLAVHPEDIEQQYKDFLENVGDWTRTVKAQLYKLSPFEAQKWGVLTGISPEVMARKFPFAIHDEHLKKLRMTAERINMLQDVLDQYGRYWNR